MNDVRSELVANFRARCTLLWVKTQEEQRAERDVTEAAATVKCETKIWDLYLGLCDATGGVIDSGMKNDPGKMLTYIYTSQERTVFILRDLPETFQSASIRRAVRTIARKLQSEPRASAKTIVILSPSGDIPPDLAGHTVLVEYPLPTREEISGILDEALSALSEEDAAKAAGNGGREKVIDAAVGLTSEGVANCFAKSLATSRVIDPVLIAKEKKAVVSKQAGLEWYDPDPRGLAAVAGLEVVKRFADVRRQAFSENAREYGLPAPRGILLVGVSGCGKSLSAKAIASSWEMPLLKMDLGGLKSKWVGGSEENIRGATKVAETIAPCVVWVDEIEKSIDTSGSAADGNVSKDQLGYLLNWMQERVGAVFVIATSNDISQLPPELLRKGRFDEIFFVDLPNRIERRGVLEVTIRQYGRDPEKVGDLAALVEATEGWSGAELADLVKSAMYEAYFDGGREPTAADLESGAKEITPLSETAKEKIDALRDWATSRCRPASIPETTLPTQKGRAIEFES